MLHNRQLDSAILFLRLFVGGIVIIHVIGKLQAYNAVIGGYPPLLLWSHLASFVVFTGLEAIFSIMIMCGVCTNFAAFIMALGSIVKSVLVFHSSGWCGVESQILYIGIYTFLVIAGGGGYSPDYRFCRKKRLNNP